MNRFTISGQKNGIERFGNNFDKILKQFGKSPTKSSSYGQKLTKTETVGLILTVVSFGIIFSPYASSESDPYPLKWFNEKVKDLFVVITESVLPTNQELIIKDKSLNYVEVGGRKIKFIVYYEKDSVILNNQDLRDKLLFGKLKSVIG